MNSNDALVASRSENSDIDLTDPCSIGSPLLSSNALAPDATAFWVKVKSR